MKAIENCKRWEGAHQKDPKNLENQKKIWNVYFTDPKKFSEKHSSFLFSLIPISFPVKVDHRITDTRLFCLQQIHQKHGNVGEQQESDRLFPCKIPTFQYFIKLSYLLPGWRSLNIGSLPTRNFPCKYFLWIGFTIFFFAWTYCYINQATLQANLQI